MWQPISLWLCSGYNFLIEFLQQLHLCSVGTGFIILGDSNNSLRWIIKVKSSNYFWYKVSHVFMSRSITVWHCFKLPNIAEPFSELNGSRIISKKGHTDSERGILPILLFPCWKAAWRPCSQFSLTNTLSLSLPPSLTHAPTFSLPLSLLLSFLPYSTMKRPTSSVLFSFCWLDARTAVLTCFKPSSSLFWLHLKRPTKANTYAII